MLNKDINDKTAKEILQIAEDYDIHIHELDPNHPIPHFTMATDTHFLMLGADIIHVGNLITIPAFLYRYEKDNQSI